MNGKYKKNYRKYKNKGYNSRCTELSPAYKKALKHYLIDGCGKEMACIRAGLSVYSQKDVFHHPLIIKAIEEHMDELEKNMTAEKMELIEALRKIVNAPTRPSLQSIIRKYRPANRDDPYARKKLESEELIQKAPTASDRIAAIRELAVLLGIREEKSKVDVSGDEIIKTVEQRRKKLSGEAEIESVYEET